MKNQFILKLSAATAMFLLLTQLFGCAAPLTTAPPREPMVVAMPANPSSAPAPVPTAAPMVSQEAALDKNEVIIDKPPPVQTEVATLLAKITPAQLSRLNQALKLASETAYPPSTVNQATPKIRAFIERISCMRQYNDGGSAVLQSLAAPGVSFKFFVPPMHGTKLHNKNNCLTVTMVALTPLSYRGLASMPAIQIKVSYLAEDSGETTTSNHEINKSNKGVWWFTR